MELIFTILFMSSIILLFFTAPATTLPALVSGGTKAVTLSLELCAVMSVWLGIMQMVERTGLTEKLAKLMRPLIRKIFGKVSPKAEMYITANLSANMLGLGNAATPMGIKAMQELDDGSGKATKAMIMLIVINSTSIGILPTTEMGLMTAAGSKNASIIIIPTLIATFISAFIGILLVTLIEKAKRKYAAHKNNKKNDDLKKEKLKNTPLKNTAVKAGRND